MWLSNSPWCLVWDAYCNVLSTQPVATKLATGMVGTFLGDMLAQSMQVGVAAAGVAAVARHINALLFMLWCGRGNAHVGCGKMMGISRLE